MSRINPVPWVYGELPRARTQTRRGIRTTFISGPVDVRGEKSVRDRTAPLFALTGMNPCAPRLGVDTADRAVCEEGDGRGAAIAPWRVDAQNSFMNGRSDRPMRN